MVLPNEVRQVKKVLEICRKNNTPIVTRGAGTGLSGGAMPLKDSVVLGLSKLTKVISINPEEQTAVVQPGVRNLAISEAADEFGLYYACLLYTSDAADE